jgi:hypothetical protein
MMRLRLGGFLGVVLYTSVGRFGFPNDRPIERAQDGVPERWRRLRSTGNGVLIVGDQLEQRRISIGKYECVAVRLHESLGVILNPISVRFPAMILSEGSRLGR